MSPQFNLTPDQMRREKRFTCGIMETKLHTDNWQLVTIIINVKQNMKNYLFAFFLSMSVCTAYTQCVFESNEKDAFTGVTTKRTKLINIGKGYNTLNVMLGSSDSLKFISFFGWIKGCINQNSAVLLKFSDNTVLELKNQGEHKLQGLRVGADGSQWLWRRTI